MSTRRIILLGFMACGKTTVGEALARKLDCGFLDLDSFITDREGRSPAEIITQDGEARFRELETLALRDALQHKHSHVIAVGGGTWTIPANRTLAALYDCVTIWIDTPFEVCWERIASAKTKRPLAADLEGARRRFEERRELYGLAERRIVAEAEDEVSRVVEKIFKET